MDKTGLSPRVRGNRVKGSCVSPSVGSIPACAGEPYFMLPGGCEGTVYPRVCGGTIFNAAGRGIRLGLSPRVRGNPICCLSSHLCIGSIPACAGEPIAGTWFTFLYGVYPRVCGGTGPRSEKMKYCTGLSPRVRGNLHQPRFSNKNNRSIPACAGEPGS